jgi:prepilin-type processing-associated H-X9-DG protein
MKTLAPKVRNSGFTVVELLGVIIILAILAAMLIPVNPRRRGKATQIVCLNNQKQIALGLTLFKDDHLGDYPWQVSATNSGFLEFAATSQIFPYFRPISEYFDKQSQIFICPKDPSKQRATNITQLTDDNISYFLNLSATTNRPSDTVLTGDRNLLVNGKPVNPGRLVITTNLDVSWTRDFHSSGGNLAFADGHAEWVKTNRLNSVFQQQPFAMNWLCVP